MKNTKREEVTEHFLYDSTARQYLSVPQTFYPPQNHNTEVKN